MKLSVSLTKAQEEIPNVHLPVNLKKAGDQRIIAGNGTCAIKRVKNDQASRKQKAANVTPLIIDCPLTTAKASLERLSL